jgi:hypothetical protein
MNCATQTITSVSHGLNVRLLGAGGSKAAEDVGDAADEGDAEAVADAEGRDVAEATGRTFPT